MRKQKLIILVGLPASGKSCYASNYIKTHENTVVISTDRIKQDIKDLQIQIKDETKVFSEMQHRVRKSLRFGKDVIINATNLKIKYRKPFINLARSVNKDISIEAHVIVSSIDSCVDRDEKREKHLGQQHIVDKVGEFQIPTKGEGFNVIEFYYNSPVISSEKSEIDFEYFSLALRSATYNGMNCASLGEALSILAETQGYGDTIQIASFLFLLGRFMTTNMDYAQCSAYLILNYLMGHPKVVKNKEMFEDWLKIIAMVNYSTLPLNWSRKYNYLFKKSFVNGLYTIMDNLRKIQSNADIQKIYLDYYGAKDGTKIS